jgi:ryanodine receptor 2
MTPYIPAPIDTSNISLPEALTNLLERLAENTHDVWAATRLAQGWSYGLTRDDANKKHPCLVPYSQLPESEKEYDRRTAAETLKAILTLGYQISSPPKEREDASGSC